MVEKKKLSELKLHENNPRFIRDDKFKKLVQSIKDFPEMLEKRPLVVDEQGVILGGNMRYRACLELKMKEVPVIIASGWSEEKKKEFIVKDNISLGQFDFDILSNTWDVEDLLDWGMDAYNFGNDQTNINLDDFFEEADEDDQRENKQKIILEYTDEEYSQVMEAFGKHEGSRESIVYKLLGL